MHAIVKSNSKRIFDTQTQEVISTLDATVQHSTDGDLSTVTRLSCG
jgi:hypothetical protein